MVKSVNVIGRGRVGSALAARLDERGVRAARGRASSSLLCVPDAAIGEVAAGLAPGPWVAHVSGATPLSALDPHERRFSLHPLQTFTRARGAEQLDGAWAAVTAESDEAQGLGFELARSLGLRAFRARRRRPAALPRGRGRSPRTTSSRSTRRPPGSWPRPARRRRRSSPLMRRTIENGFELTGPIERGDWATVEAHLEAIRARAPRPRAAVPTLLARGDGAMRIATSPQAELRSTGERRPRADDGRLPRGPPRALPRGARASATSSSRACSSTRRSSARARISPRYPRDEERDASLAEEAGVDLLFAPRAEEIYPPGFETWVEVERLGSILEGEHRPGHFRGVATVCLKLFNIVRPRRAYFGQKDAQQVAVVRRMVRDLDLPARDPRRADRARRGRPRALLAQRATSRRRSAERALALPRALATRDPRAREPARRPRGRLRRGRADFEPPVLAAAVRVGVDPPDRQRRPGRRAAMSKHASWTHGQAPADRARRDEAPRRRRS